MRAGQHVLGYFCRPDGIQYKWHSVDDRPDVSAMQPGMAFPIPQQRGWNMNIYAHIAHINKKPQIHTDDMALICFNI